MTGFTGGNDRENYFAKPTDHPGHRLGLPVPRRGAGATCPATSACPRYPGYSQGLRRAGPYGGYLGRQYDPLFSRLRPEVRPRVRPEQATSTTRSAPHRASRGCRRSTTCRADARRARPPAIAARSRSTTQCRDARDGARAPDAMDQSSGKAFDLLTSSRRPHGVRPVAASPRRSASATAATCSAPSLLVARRLVEAGVTFVTVTPSREGNGHWDTHEQQLQHAQDVQPAVPRPIGSALLDDLDAPRPAGLDAGRRHGRHGPHAAGQRHGRPRPLAAVRLLPAVRRRRQGRASSTAPATSRRPTRSTTRSRPATSSPRSTTCSASTRS